MSTPPSPSDWLLDPALGPDLALDLIDAPRFGFGPSAAFPWDYRMVDAPTFAPDPANGLVVTLRRPALDARSNATQLNVVVVYDPQYRHFRSSCPVDPYAFCPHARRAAVSLCLSPALREAIIAGDDVLVRREVGRLAEIEQEFRASIEFRRTLAAWLPERAREAVPPLSWSIDVAQREELYRSPPVIQAVVELRAPNPLGGGLVDHPMLARARLDPIDRAIFVLTEPLARNRKGVQAVGRNASLVVQRLRDSHGAVTHDKRPVRFGDEPLALRFAWDDNEHGSTRTLTGRWHDATNTVDLDVAGTMLLDGPDRWLWVPATHTFHPIDPSVPPDLAVAVTARPRIETPRAQMGLLYDRLRSVSRRRRVTLPAPETFGVDASSAPMLTLRVGGTALEVSLRLDVHYGDKVFVAGHVDADGGDNSTVRDPDLERAAIERVREVTGADLGEKREGTLLDEDAVRFWQEGVSSFRNGGVEPAIEVTVPESLRQVHFRPPVRAKTTVKLVDGLIDTKVQFSADEVAADIAQLRRALADKRRWIVLDDGSLARITDTIAELADDVHSTLGITGHSRLAAHQLGRIGRWVEQSEQHAVDEAVDRYRHTLRAMAVDREAVLPAMLTATLRPYQLQGLAWLQFLDALGAGGILADDMGLGKTVTTLALIAWSREKNGRKASLVVCPTSVAGNWVREAARFTPGLDVRLWHGTNRKAIESEIEQCDVLVTTYALLRYDLETLTRTQFRYVVLDEAQFIKNAEAQTTSAALALQSEHRLALSGTPVENRLRELWSLMEFCNPGMLGTVAGFERKFGRPVALDPQGPATELLRALVRPFVLRRSKRDVLTDLPPKVEIEQVCDPASEQRRRYDALAHLLRTDVTAHIKRDGLAKSGLSILTALLRLRQMACDPRLVDPKAPASASTKREAFLDLVRALAAEGRRTLVFSQFVELLKLWRQDLDDEGIAYEWLDGSTKQRDEVVARFQNGDAPVFMLSLKAGGTGLNLTAADTVIHCDPWWNPAVEDQATDRAHRIGQTRSVTVYRLVMRGSIEEKIEVLKARKRAIVDAVVSADAGAMGGLREEDVATLLGEITG